VEVSGRGLDHKAWPDRDAAALALIGVTVGHEPEHPGGVLDLATLIAAQTAVRTMFSMSSSVNRLGIGLWSSGLSRLSCRTPGGPAPLMTWRACALMISMN
jgi:hypothetical protein